MNTEGFPLHSTPLAAGPALYSWAVSMGTAHLLCMCVSGSVLKPDASALPGSNKEELPACKINSPQCVRVWLRNLGRQRWEDISCFNAQVSLSMGVYNIFFSGVYIALRLG